MGGEAGHAADEWMYSTEHFDLRSDLANLDRVHKAGAAEATIFYCARILEALAAGSLQRLGVTPSDNVLTNLQRLQNFDPGPRTTHYCANALRRYGNEVRHIKRAITTDDADIALLFAERFVDWFFRSSPTKPGPGTGGRSLVLSRRVEMRNVLSLIDNPDVGPETIVDSLLGERSGELLETPALPAIVIERLLDSAAYSHARAVLTAALARFPDDLRLRQLTVLLPSRAGDLAGAIAALEELPAKARYDEESIGITAGVYKRMWRSEMQPEWLIRSHAKYLDGWRRSKQTNSYLGINAAATALWMGQPARSRELARGVRDLLRGPTRAPTLRASRIFWEDVTLAEAELLLGELAEARTMYHRAFQSHSTEIERIHVAREQASEIARTMGFDFSFDRDEAACATTAAHPVLVVGVTGHRTLPDDEAFLARVRGVLDKLRAAGTVKLAALSALAEGADRLVARLVLGDPAGGVLRVVLPLEIADYIHDFAALESRSEFASLLGRAESIRILAVDDHPEQCECPRCTAARASGSEGNAAREAAYESGGQFVVERSDVLVALWDGLPSRGRGGTAEIVDHARRLYRRVAWIQTTPPFAVTLERFGT
jgi:hypothetical protein